MLLTLHAASLRSLLAPAKGKPTLELLDLPRFARQELDMHGLNLTTDLLKGATRPVLEQIRERADKERCACLLLIEPEPLGLADESDEVGGAGVDRAQRVLRAGSLLGCNAVAVSVDSPDDDDFVDFAADRFRQIVEVAEKLDMNILVSPREGLTEKPERVAELIKKIGGFRVGTLPDFAEAVKTDDPAAYLRKIVPYASVVCATTVELAPPVEDEDRSASATKRRAEQPESEKAPELSEEDAGDEDFDIDDPAPGRGGGLESLINAVLSESGIEDDEETPPVHSPYELQPLVDAVSAVGFDGSLAVRFVGGGDAVVGTDLSRWALEYAVQRAKG